MFKHFDKRLRHGPGGCVGEWGLWALSASHTVRRQSVRACESECHCVRAHCRLTLRNDVLKEEAENRRGERSQLLPRTRAPPPRPGLLVPKIDSGVRESSKFPATSHAHTAHSDRHCQLSGRCLKGNAPLQQLQSRDVEPVSLRGQCCVS